jgi:hypothetical protein
MTGNDDKWWLPEGFEKPQEPGWPRTTYQPEPSKQLAGWALALSLVPCLGGPQIAAVALAVIVLVRSSDGRAHGRGMAIAALCVVGAWVLALCAWVAIEIVNDNGRDGGREVGFGDLREGDCFNMPSGHRVRSVDAVPCHESHDAEVYRTFRLSAGDYPGDDAVLARAEQGCTRKFDEFVGTPYGDSVLDVFYLYPAVETWNLGERGVTCSVYQPTGPTGQGHAKVTGTLRDARR